MGSVHDSSKSPASQTSPYTTYVVTPETVVDQSWCLDSRASHHVTNDVSYLQQVNKYHGKNKLTVGDGKCLSIHHLGIIVLNSKDDKPILLKNVIRSPKYPEIS